MVIRVVIYVSREFIVFMGASVSAKICISSHPLNWSTVREEKENFLLKFQNKTISGIGI